ncbi:hypothetical protein DUNSADRAFT_5620 [Dunaliella salina]|uniref:ATP-dependent DNA helicase n=1 Tax=Dunaliella salina TaxID=3046 RepID=A0ABQ7GPZ7_DUNSA|nr:hypothetical protein DUNSADRAFT_5620 [Dunaliella salina]|eukprot:KAF5836661.1 hypothetical protein DUNSADRAFT_5620 [Dunaliella salina]
MHHAAALSRQEEGDLFGGHHFLLCGDPCQHAPVKGHTLHSPRAVSGRSSGATDMAREGQQLYFNIQRVLLTTQHRRSQDPGAAKLARYSNMFDGLSHAPRSNIEEFVRDLQSRLCHNDRVWTAKDPRVMVLRHCVRSTVNFCFAAMQASLNNRRVLMWPARHSRTGGGQLSEEELLLARQESPKSANGVPAVQIYFDGMRVAFTDSQAPEAGRINNNFGVARKIL